MFAPFSLFLVLLVQLQQQVSAYPYGAGGCTGVNGSVGDSHLEGPILETGSLALVDYQVELVDTSSSSGTGEVLKEGTTTEIKVGTLYSIKVSSTSDKSPVFEGFLFRLADASTGEVTSSFLTVPEGYVTKGVAQIADVCTSLDIAGITHTDAREMTEFDVDMLVDTAMKLELQVTLVSKNDQTDNGTHRSIYHWDTYMLDAVGSSTSSGSGKNSTSSSGSDNGSENDSGSDNGSESDNGSGSGSGSDSGSSNSKGSSGGRVFLPFASVLVTGFLAAVSVLYTFF